MSKTKVDDRMFIVEATGCQPQNDMLSSGMSSIDNLK